MATDLAGRSIGRFAGRYHPTFSLSRALATPRRAYSTRRAAHSPQRLSNRYWPESMGMRQSDVAVATDARTSRASRGKLRMLGRQNLRLSFLSFQLCLYQRKSIAAPFNFFTQAHNF
jgi:hypothetical protein